MAATIQGLAHDWNGANRENPFVTLRGLWEWDAAYAASGEPITVAMVNAALLALGVKEQVAEISFVEIDPPADRSILPTWDKTNSKIWAFAKGAAASLTAPTCVTSAALNLDGGKLSDALPAGALAVVGGRSSGGTAGPIKLVPGAPAATLEAQFIPASRKIQLLAADANTGLVVQYLTSGSLTANTSSYLAEAAGDLSAATYDCPITVICRKVAA